MIEQIAEVIYNINVSFFPRLPGDFIRSDRLDLNFSRLSAPPSRTQEIEHREET